MLSFLDRLFYSTSGVVNKTMKVGAAVVSSRRAGSTSAFDEINKYFTISAMPIVSSTYWNEVHGFTATDVEDDLEGLQTMRNLGRNMAFLIKAIKAAAQTDGLPTQERESFTSFHTESSNKRSTQIPASAPKLQSSLIMLGPRKAAVRRPQHGYKSIIYKKKGCVSCPITNTLKRQSH